MSGEALSHVDVSLAEWIQQLVEGKNPLAQMSEEKLKELHSLAFLLYRDQQYQHATHFFRLLAVARPSEVNYWKGFGACLQMVKDYEDALNCYMSAQILNKEKPDLYLFIHMADCYFALNQKESGLKALEAARLGAKKTNDMRILKHCALMRELWSK